MIAAVAPSASPGSTPGPVLRDIHLPAEPAWWPPAPGWWLLVVIVLAVVGIVVLVWRRHRRVRAKQRLVLDELDRLVARDREHGSSSLLQDLHQLLRRVARQHDAHATLQRGEAWRQTLARVPVDAATLDRLFAIDQLIYQPQGEGDDEATVAAVAEWLRLAVKPSNWKIVPAAQEAADV